MLGYRNIPGGRNSGALATMLIAGGLIVAGATALYVSSQNYKGRPQPPQLTRQERQEIIKSISGPDEAPLTAIQQLIYIDKKREYLSRRKSK